MSTYAIKKISAKLDEANKTQNRNEMGKEKAVEQPECDENEVDKTADVNLGTNVNGEVTASLDKADKKDISNNIATEKTTDTGAKIGSDVHTTLASLAAVSEINEPPKTPITAIDNVEKTGTCLPEDENEGMQRHEEGKKVDGSQTVHKVCSPAASPEMEGNTVAAAASALAAFAAVSNNVNTTDAQTTITFTEKKLELNVPKCER